MAQPYKPGPQARYLVDRMSESEKHLLKAMNKLSDKFDAYGRRLTSMGSGFSTVQSQMDLAMQSIQALQHEQIQLFKSLSAMVKSLSARHFSGSLDAGGIMGAVPDPVAPNTSLASTTPSASLPLQHPGTNSLPSSARGSGSLPGSGIPSIGDLGYLRWISWVFDGSDVRIWLDKCSTYFHLYSIPVDFRVTAVLLHMSGKASH
jgi:hypothetical protein